jgi:flagellar basal-body rod protein FlgC
MESENATDARDDVRTAIVEAAARLLREQGARGMTTRGVAQAAGVQAPTIYRLFGDKDGLIEAVAVYVMATYVAAKSERAARELGDPVEDLHDAWRTHVDFGLANPDLFVLLSTPGRLQRSPATADGTFESQMDEAAAANLVRVASVEQKRTAFRVEHMPGHPAANANGYVKLPNVDLVVEAADMREANRSYEANIQVIKQAREMISMTLDLLRSS